MRVEIRQAGMDKSLSAYGTNGRASDNRLVVALGFSFFKAKSVLVGAPVFEINPLVALKS